MRKLGRTPTRASRVMSAAGAAVVSTAVTFGSAANAQTTDVDISPQAKLLEVMKEAHEAHKDTTTYVGSDGQEVEGKPQGYIPAWAGADPDKFGIAAVTPDGEILKVGDTEETFIMTSAIKPFIALYILAHHGEEEMRKYINIEAAGQPFNTKQLDSSGRAPNHMINLGAICGSSWIDGENSREKIANFMEFFNKFSANGKPFPLDIDVAWAGIASGKPNKTIASILDEKGLLGSTPQEALEVYYALNFIEVNAIDMAVMAATIRNGGINPITGVDVLDDMGLSEDQKIDLIADLQAQMVTAGMYDAAGKWTQEVGIPAKSCVGGGVLVMSPMAAEQAVGISFYGPRLDGEGNSLQAVLAARDIVEAMDWNPYKMGLKQAREAQLERHAGPQAPGSDLNNLDGAKP